MNKICLWIIILLLPLLIISCRDKPDKLDFWLEERNFTSANEQNDQGEIPVVVAVDEENLEIVALMVEQGVDVDVRATTGETPLGLACARGNLEISEVLLEGGADVEFDIQRGEDTEKPLHLAVAGGKLELVALLLSNGSDPNVSGIDGMTPLHIAVLHKNMEMVKKLIDAGADIDNLPDHYGQTPLQMALQQENLDIASLLINAGANTDCLFKIEPQQAGWFEIGMTPQEIESAEKIYPQAKIQNAEMMSEGESVPIIEVYYGDDPEVKLMMLLNEMTLEICRIEIYSPDFKTADNLGIGSTYGDIRKIYDQPEIFWGEGGLPVVVIEPDYITFVLDPGDWWGTGDGQEVPPEDTEIIKIYLW